MEDRDPHMDQYEDRKTYEITDVVYSKCYIRSTCEMLSKRMENIVKINYKRYKQERQRISPAAIHILNE